MAIKHILAYAGLALIASAACAKQGIAVHEPRADYAVEALTPEIFDERVMNNSPYIVDFWRERCGSCVEMKPVFHEVCGQLEGSVYCGSYDTWQEDRSNPNRIPLRYDVRYVPALRFFCNGVEDAERRFSGSRSEDEFMGIVIEFIEQCREQ